MAEIPITVVRRRRRARGRPAAPLRRGRRRRRAACSAPTATSATRSRSAARSPTPTTSAPPASATTSPAATRPSAPTCAPTTSAPTCRGSWTRSSRASASAWGARTTSPSTTRCSTRSRDADFAPQRQLYDLARQAARHGRRRQPLRRPVRGRRRVRLDRRALRLARVRAQDGLRVPRARAGLAVRRARDRTARWTARRCCCDVDSELGAELHRRDGARRRVRLRGPRHRGRQGARDPRRARRPYEVHNHHNFAWRERHHGTDVWVIRKGCTPAFPGQEGFVGATMGEPSVILRGVGVGAGRELLYSTVHGAGRVMSRTKAAGQAAQARRSATTATATSERVAGSERDRAARCPRRTRTRGCIQAPRSDRAGARSTSPPCRRAARGGDRAARRRGRRGAGCVQAPRRGARRARRHDRDRSTGSRRSASRWPAPARSTPTRTDPSPARPALCPAGRDRRSVASCPDHLDVAPRATGRTSTSTR